MSKFDYLDAAVSLESLREPPANQLEALKDDRKGQHSIRINRQFRICFVWTADGPQHVTIVDYHSGSYGPHSYPPPADASG